MQIKNDFIKKLYSFKTLIKTTVNYVKQPEREPNFVEIRIVAAWSINILLNNKATG